jgi:hypothetical protein
MVQFYVDTHDETVPGVAYIYELCKIGSSASAPPDVFADYLFLFYFADLPVAMICVLRSLLIFFLGEKGFRKVRLRR